MTSEQTLFVGLAKGAAQPDPISVVPAGVLKLVRRGNVESAEFAYGSRYVMQSDAESLNPLHLPLQQDIFKFSEARLRDGGAMPLTLRDALPDSWGRRVLEAKHGALSDAQALLLTNEDRVGAMVFSEALPIPRLAPEPRLYGLDELAQAARQFESGQEPDADLLRLLQGGSLGGARPKATFVHQQQRYIAKFAARGDDHDVAVLEAVTMTLAKACGIEVPDFFLQPVPTGHALVMRRFDRGGPVQAELRHHYLSASALLDVAYENNAGGSYVEFAQALRRISIRPETDLSELYRRMVFNLFVGNTDDHVKNHGTLLVKNRLYRLAPAFDLVVQLRTNTGYQSLAITPGNAESRLDLARQAAPAFGLSDPTANVVIHHIGEIVRDRAYISLKAHGADKPLIDQVRDFLDRQRKRIGAAA